jgi:hypothetical protein
VRDRKGERVSEGEREGVRVVEEAQKRPKLKCMRPEVASV